jgi:taurine dioxygenase
MGDRRHTIQNRRGIERRRVAPNHERAKQMMEIRRLGEQIGAEIVGVDVKTMNDEIFARIYRAWLDYNVVAVRGQELTIEDFLAYSRRFGRLHTHYVKSANDAQYPELTVLGVNKFGPDGKLKLEVYARGAGGFHTDGAYDKEPFKATQLYALAIPSRGGDTHFASLYAAYDALPQRLRQRLEGWLGTYLIGHHRWDTVAPAEAELKARAVSHPILRTHPETGRKVLYFDATKIMRIEGLEKAESDALIEELEGYTQQPGRGYCHKWSKGDIVIWDNRCSLHKAAGDYPPEEDRIHWRVSIKEAA